MATRKLHGQLMAELYSERNAQLVYGLSVFETVTGVGREKLVYAVAAVYASYLVVGYFAELVCNSVGFVYPIVQSIKAIHTPNKDDDTQWLVYWTIFALFSVGDFFSEPIMRFLPLYWLAKCAFLLWLYMPQTRGAEQVYRQALEPFLRRHQLLTYGSPTSPAPMALQAPPQPLPVASLANAPPPKRKQRQKAPKTPKTPKTPKVAPQPLPPMPLPPPPRQEAADAPNAVESPPPPPQAIRKFAP